MVLKVVKYGEPVLEKKAEPIADFGSPELQKLVDDMFDTMYEANGIGLAATIGRALLVALVAAMVFS